MKSKSIKKRFFLSKLFAKIIRKFGFEIIDHANLEIPASNQFAHENLSKSGVKSITVPLGTTKIKKRINSLVIIIRSYTFGDLDRNRVMLDQSKKRIFDAPKIEYTLRTIKSVIKSCELAKNYFKDLKVKILVTDDKSSKDSLSRMNKLLESTNIETKLININENEFENEISTTDVNGKEISKNMISNMRNILKSIQIAQNDDSDLFYFLEDDYIHTINSITEMLFTYEKISSQLDKEIFLCPADYPYLYSTIDNTKLFFGNMRHWRTVNETLITFLTSKNMIVKYLDELKSMGSKRHHPMELNLHKIYEKEYCLSPVPSLAMHTTNINSIYGLPPNFNWKEIWDENSP